MGGDAGGAKHVKVVLDGQGGDEVFGGYWHNRVSLLAHLLRQGASAPLRRRSGEP